MPRRSRFGSVYRKSRKDGTAYAGWFVRYVEAGRRVERGGFENRDLAEDFLSARRLERSHARVHGLRELRRVELGAAVDEFLAWLVGRRRPRTIASKGVHLRPLAERFKGRDVLEVRQEDVARHLEHVRADDGHAASTLDVTLTSISGFFSWAVREGYARTNPARGVRAHLPRVDLEEPPYLAPDEIRVVCSAVPPEYRPAALLMAHAGLRRDEAVYLRHAEVRRDRGAVTIRGDRSKGHKARTVPLTPESAAALGAVLDAAATPIDGEERVFGFSANWFNKQFREAMVRIGRSDVTPRTLRHAFGSGLAVAGVDLEVIRRLMGHRSIKTTQRYACHRPRSAEVDAIRALGSHLDSSSASHARKTS